MSTPSPAITDRALGPGLRSIDDQPETVVLSVFDDGWSQLLQDAACNLLILIAEVFLSILHGAIKKLLLTLNLFLQIRKSLFVQLVLLSGELFLQTLEFIVLPLQFDSAWARTFFARPRGRGGLRCFRRSRLLMLMVPTLVPVLGAPVVAGAVAAGLAGMAADPDGVAALPVWANAENVNVTATARSTRRNLLVIGLVELLGTCFSEHASGNEFQLSLL